MPSEWVSQMTAHLYRPDPNADDHDRLLDLAMEVSEDLTGICLACRQTANDGQVEPDASGYVCDWCEEPAVIGAQEYILWTVA